jgi:hypothetical protein
LELRKFLMKGYTEARSLKNMSMKVNGKNGKHGHSWSLSKNYFLQAQI